MRGVSRASLVIYSATHPASAVTDALGVQPTSSGERADGHQRSFWRLEVEATGSTVAALEALLAAVPFVELPATYVRQVRWAGPSRFAIPAPLLAQLAGLGDLVATSDEGVLEHALLSVTRPTEFEVAFAQARPIISGMPGFRSLTLSRGVESPSQYLLLVRWDTVEDHEVGFRQSPDYQRWRALLHEFYEPFPVVEHFTDVE